MRFGCRDPTNLQVQACLDALPSKDGPAEIELLLAIVVDATLEFETDDVGLSSTDCVTCDGDR